MLADIIVGILVGVVGLALCFAGYRFFLILLPVFGFIAGFWVGASAVTALFGDGFLSTVSSWLSGFLVGLVFAVLSYLFYWLAIVVFGLAIGASVGSGFMGAIGIDSTVLTVTIAAVCAVALAAVVLVINLPKFVIVFLSSIAGATGMIAAVMLVFNQLQRGDLYHGATLAIINQSFFWSMVWIVLIIGGIMVQTFNTADFTIETPEPPMSAHA